MKSLNQLHKSKVFVLFTFLTILFLSVSCANDNETSVEPYFTIEENPTGLAVDVNGLTKSYIVRAKGHWKIVPQGEANWVKVFPAEGDDDGIFKIIVNKNNTFDSRILNFAFINDGKEQPALFRVEQQANVPFIIVDKADEGVSVTSNGGEFGVKISANVNWTYSLSNANWLSVVEASATSIKFSALKNKGVKRSAILTISSADYPSLTKTISIMQSDGSVVLEEHFDWLAYGSTIFYTTTAETRIDNAWTTEEKAKGWTSTSNVFSNNEQLVYARTGFVKLGKTGYGGDFISPKFEMLEEPTTVKVTFKAVPYQTKAGTKDDNILKVGVVGPGTVSVSSFTIDNWPDYTLDPDCINIWKSPSANYSFTISGATSQTQLSFLGGDFNLVGVGAGKNRIFIDDVKVEIIE